MAETLKSKDKTKHKSKDRTKKRKRHALPSVPELRKKARVEIDRSTTAAVASSDTSNFAYRLTTTSLYLSLAPKYSFHPERTFAHLLTRGASTEQAAYLRSLSPVTGIQKHHLDPLLMTFFEPVDGVVIGYDNIRFESSEGRINAEAPYPHVWTTVDLLVWRPTKGMVLKGWVNLQSASHIGLLVDNTWNVSIPFARIPETWKYKDAAAVAAAADAEDGMEVEQDAEAAEGAWVNEKGEKIEGLLKFVVESVRGGGSIFIMEGTLLAREKIENAVVP